MIISLPTDEGSEGEANTMNILCLMRKDPDATISGLLDAQKREHTVTVVDIRKDKDYDKMVKLIFSSASVISW